MCGIFGTTSITDVTRQMLPILAWEMESRGRDAWGATNGDEIVKNLGPITESWQVPEHWQEGIFHTRSASTGSGKEVNNAHPFEFQTTDGKRLIGIHNGIIRNHKELNDKYQRAFEVDSMHIFAHLAGKMDLKELEGYAALAWYVDGELNFAKFNNWDMHVCLLETGEIVFASKLDPIKKSARMFGSKIKVEYDIKDRRRYFIKTLENGEKGLWSAEELPFASTWVRHDPVTSGGSRYNGPYGDYENDEWFVGRSRSTGGFSGGSQSTAQRASGFSTVTNSESMCAQCGRMQIDRKKQLLCSSCLTAHVQAVRYFRGQSVGGVN